MDLWIRSQDKSMLVKVNEISIQSNVRSDLRSWEILVNDYPFGDYATKERTKKVIDEIQDVLVLKDMYKYDKELVLKSWENVDAEKVKMVREQMCVYEMPEE